MLCRYLCEFVTQTADTAWSIAQVPTAQKATWNNFGPGLGPFLRYVPANFHVTPGYTGKTHPVAF